MAYSDYKEAFAELAGLDSDEKYSLALSTNERSSGRVTIQDDSFTYGALEDSCSTCYISELDGEGGMTERAAFILLNLFFSKNPADNFLKGKFEDYIFSAGYSFLIFTDKETESDRCRALKNIFNESPSHVNPNTGNDVILYTLTRAEFQDKYKAFKDRLEAEELAKEIKAKAAQQLLDKRAAELAKTKQKVAKPSSMGIGRDYTRIYKSAMRKK